MAHAGICRELRERRIRNGQSNNGELSTFAGPSDFGFGAKLCGLGRVVLFGAKPDGAKS
jgi:hypothetical protein